MANCNNCNTPIGAIETMCTTCGDPVGFPNVRAASEDQATLDVRYEAALDAARQDGREAELSKFSEKIKETFAAINVDLRFLDYFLTAGNQLYGTYQLSLNAETRKAATAANDRNRAGVEGTLFGTYGQKIRYAALSLGNGLKSYGNYSIRLRDIAVRNRSSLLEQNSYVFLERHDLRPKDPIPSGFRAVWGERHKLAVAKLGHAVSETTREEDYPELLLTNGGTRANDEFIEVHIYGPLDSIAIESVKGNSKLKKQPDKALAANAKERLIKAGKHWIEE